jgi:hypothetical protein
VGDTEAPTLTGDVRGRHPSAPHGHVESVTQNLKAVSCGRRQRAPHDDYKSVAGTQKVIHADDIKVLLPGI